jgi:hypothetical protein
MRFPKVEKNREDQISFRTYINVKKFLYFSFKDFADLTENFILLIEQIFNTTNLVNFLERNK